MFVLHALVLTFITTPLTLWIYPVSVRGAAGMSHAAVAKAAKDEEAKKVAAEDAFKTRFSIVLDKLEQVCPADL